MLIPIDAPGVLDKPGRYRLQGDIHQTANAGAAIEIRAPGVSLDLGGFAIRGPGPGEDALTRGVDVGAVEDVRVFGGAITGFWQGVKSAATRLTLSELDLSGNTYIAATIDGDESRVLGCRSTMTGGYTREPYAVGVNVVGGVGTLIESNVFGNIYRQADSPESVAGEGVAVIVGASAGSCRVINNRFENDRVEPHTIGVFCGKSGEHVVRANTIIDFYYGVQGGGTIPAPMECDSNVLWLRSTEDSSVGISIAFGSCTRNLVVGYEDPIDTSLDTSSNCLVRGSVGSAIDQAAWW